MRVIAEGLETDEQLRQVRELGYDLAQGYHFSSPLPGKQRARCSKPVPCKESAFGGITGAS